MKKKIIGSNGKAATRTPRRGFCVLDREEALKQAVKAVAELREIARRKPDDESISLKTALHALEPALNSILQFSGEPFSDDLFSGIVVNPNPADLEQIRKRAAGTVKVLRNVLKDARADLSVAETECAEFDAAIYSVENELLPPPGASPKARLPF